jgi:pimeloyl-ACP methyl ester carboxylesterase
MPIAHVNNCDFYYEVTGNGPDVVFIHGEDHGIEMFEPQVAHLSPHYRCVTYYRRGHGRSQLTPYGYSLRNQILDQGLSDRMRREGDAWLPILPTAPEARERVIRMMSSHLPEHYIKAAEFYTSMPNLVPRLKEIACPVLGICGEEDPSPDRPDLLAGMAEFQQVWIPGSRRFTMVEAPSAFNTAVASFLARVT